MRGQKEITERVIRLAEALGEIRAIGLSGSHARHTADALSDVDICLYVVGEIPPDSARRRAYEQLGFSGPIYFDVDFDTSRGDGLLLADRRWDMNWMRIDAIAAFLGSLEHDLDCAEWVPGGLKTVLPLHDPADEISRLQRQIPPYSDQRSRYRVQKGLSEAHLSLYGLGWLEKAVARQDHLLFAKHQFLILEQLYYTLFALNRRWFSDEKRLTAITFELSPPNLGERVSAIVTRRDENRDPAGCLRSIEQLLADTAAIARRAYLDLDLPAKWA